MMSNENYTLLMSACIKPPALNLQNNVITRTDPLVRLNDYKIAFKFWLQYNEPLINKIIFVENSGYELKELQEIASQYNEYNRQIEFLQFIASDVPTGLHYGYSELEILDYAFDNSKLLNDDNTIIKVTGRLYFPTLSKLISLTKNKNYEFISDCKDYDLFGHSQHYIITTLFLLKKEFYNKFLYDAKSKMLEMNLETGLMEVLYFRIIKPLYLEDSKRILLRFPCDVEPVGIGAHLNINYSSKKRKAQHFIRKVCKHVIPSLWI
jgi:hypothetical protein